ncbi:MAG: M15 family metallopeptidase [Treponema sp.]|jgi:hypothetical protein|nr:M15 family metallopeptidase [Treponema sp.]
MKKNVLFIVALFIGAGFLFSQNLTRIQPSNFDKQVEVDAGFVNHLRFMGNCANKLNLSIIVTGDGFRREGASLTNPVFNPANASNHLVGHAIDINIMYYGTLFTKTALDNFSTLPQPVKDFITECKSNNMRWGGDFSERDPVHFDSGLNVNNPTEWRRLYITYQSQTNIDQKIDFTGTWVGVDNNYTWIFNGSNYTLKENGVNVDRGTFSVNENQTILYQNYTHYWDKGIWLPYPYPNEGTIVNTLTILSDDRFRVTGNDGESDFDETYAKR